ncbi:terpene cyclase/mutase family protein [Nocardioides anomalus]|uniref:Terpene cyclase/mutase family protein n=1 Tax=Nocardioides anomalus TaxID=2712223 RepID=A0A6G6WAK4_9ACTN|nr:prenyltransferase/squalene oxidase repeat-containing protein [Nocardioides anomalus]QIG42239.1 terpene cyclase/mutase family protein [Nocardioides anomalus]
MKSTTLRRAAALTAGAALALGVAVAGPAAQAAPIAKPVGADPSPAAVGAAYLAKQPGADGIIVSHSEYLGTQYDTPSPGITIDAALSLDAVGGQAATVAKMATGVEASTYPTGSAGGAAKFAAFEYALGRTGAALNAAVTKANGAIATSGVYAGRLENAPGATDYESPLTQAYAAKALHDAGASNAAIALDFLLDQQCAAGFFRSDFSDKDADNQSCDPADPDGSLPSVDYTAFAVLQLQDQKAAAPVAASLSKAITWLTTQQGADGSYDGNANSTGLAAWALGISGQTNAAVKAATWLRAHQLANAGSCAVFAAADNGALVVDDLGVINAKAAPMDINANSTATYATSQALPALLWAPGGAQAGETTLSVADAFVPAGSTQNVTISGAPGDTICASTGGAGTRIVLPASGTATYPLTLPAATGAVTVSTVDAGGEADSIKITGLTAAKIKAKAPKKIAQGKKFKVKATGFAPGEPVTVKYRGKTKELTANGQGVLRVKLKATKVGTSKVKVTGALSSRKDKVTVTVVK